MKIIIIFIAILLVSSCKKEDIKPEQSIYETIGARVVEKSVGVDSVYSPIQAVKLKQ